MARKGRKLAGAHHTYLWTAAEEDALRRMALLVGVRFRPAGRRFRGPIF